MIKSPSLEAPQPRANRLGQSPALSSPGEGAPLVVACPKCGALLQPPQPVPVEGLIVPCPRCRAKLIVRPKPQEPPDLETEPPAVNPRALVDPDLRALQPDEEQIQEVVCPSCLRAMSAPLKKGRDNWATCPWCGEKFLAHSQPDWRSLELAQEPARPNYRPTMTRRPLERLVFKVDSVSQIYEVATLDYPPGWKNRLSLVVVGIILLGGGFFANFLINSWREAQSLRDTYPEPTSVKSQAYDETAFRADLVRFRRWLRDKSLTSFVIDYSGSTSRLFKRAMTQLQPNECQEFTSLTLRSWGRGGVKITGQCYDEKRPSPTILIAWKERQAILSSPNSSEIMNVVIYPANPGQGGRAQ